MHVIFYAQTLSLLGQPNGAPHLQICPSTTDSSMATRAADRARFIFNISVQKPPILWMLRFNIYFYTSHSIQTSLLIKRATLNLLLNTMKYSLLRTLSNNEKLSIKKLSWWKVPASGRTNSEILIKNDQILEYSNHTEHGPICYENSS